jgi:Grx4 family monothiol glutaredoxin
MSLQVESQEQWKELTGVSSKRGLVVHFEADWCTPCGGINAWLDSQAKALPDVVFARVDAGKLSEIAESALVTSVPHIVFYRPEGEARALERVAEVSGAKMKLLSTNLATLFGDKDQVSAHASMEAFLKYQINKDKIVLMLTGTPSRPRCGFAGRLIEMLDEYDVEYSYYDIMQDDTACQALKKFSDWPTYPQVYVNGELIGGFDICKEMHEKGTLAESLGCKKRQ